MAKKLKDTQIWTSQHWFKKLNLVHKLTWFYVTDACDHAGLWEIDLPKLIEETGVGEDFDLKKFVEAVNKDRDKFTGKATKKERLLIVQNQTLWITGHIQFQQVKDKNTPLPIKKPVVKSALKILMNRGLLNDASAKQFINHSESLEMIFNHLVIITNDYSNSKGNSKSKEGGAGGRVKAIGFHQSSQTRKLKVLPNGQVAMRQTKNGLQPIFED